MSHKLIGVLAPDGNPRPVTRHANRAMEVYVRPLSYGDLSEVSLTVWPDGKVHLVIRNPLGAVAGQYHYERDEPAV